MIHPHPELLWRATRAMIHVDEPYLHSLNSAELEADDPEKWLRMLALADAAVTRYLNPTLPIPDWWETIGPPCPRISDPFQEPEPVAWRVAFEGPASEVWRDIVTLEEAAARHFRNRGFKVIPLYERGD